MPTKGKSFETFFRSDIDMKAFLKLRKLYVFPLMAELIPTGSGDAELALPGSVFSILTSNDLGDTIAAAEALMDGKDLSAFWIALVR